MTDLEIYIECMEKHRDTAIKEGETDFAKAIQYCVVTAKECLKNINKGEK
jgi:hypothetical protein